MKNTPLENYLNTLESGLKRLSPAKRDEELREVRGHLEALAAWHSGQGQHPDDAMRAAIAQFGQAERLGRDLGHIAARAQWRSGALLCAKRLAIYGFLFGGNLLFYWSMNDKPTDFPYSLREKVLWSAMMALPALFCGHLLEKGFRDWKARRIAS